MSDGVCALVRAPCTSFSLKHTAPRIAPALGEAVLRLRHFR